MQSNRVKKLLKLAAVAAALVSGLWHSDFRGTSAAEPQDQRRRFEIVGVDAPLDQRAGSDDGAAFVIHLTGDTHGGLEPCG
jgi:hypothetical protein